MDHSEGERGRGGEGEGLRRQAVVAHPPTPRLSAGLFCLVRELGGDGLEGRGTRGRQAQLEGRHLVLHDVSAKRGDQLVEGNVPCADHAGLVTVAPQPLAAHQILEDFLGELVAALDLVELIDVDVPVRRRGEREMNNKSAGGGVKENAAHLIPHISSTVTIMGGRGRLSAASSDPGSTNARLRPGFCGAARIPHQLLHPLFLQTQLCSKVRARVRWARQNASGT